MFIKNGWLTVTLCFLIIALMLGFQFHHLSNADMNKDNGYTCNTAAQGSSRKIGQLYEWTVWADYFAKIDASGRSIGDSDEGRIKVRAFLSDGSNPPDIDEEFTLEVKGWGFIKWGEVYMKHHYSTCYQSSPTCPYADVSSGGRFGTVTAMTETWP